MQQQQAEDGGPRPGQRVIEVILPTYAMKPGEDEKFYPSKAKAICEDILRTTLAGQEYDEELAKEWVTNIGNDIKDKVKTLNIPRYKVICQITIGQVRDQGVSIASRCLWDVAHDNYASVNFSNDSLW
eukprot:CAMPEP_0197312692 /NCGR_PEP_ID=MMETSP0891-20130614/22875_1 /TAXON_ID=44058 ORGANISM="Aureoumbra lagunensis, Strain CCMP1510" /NCGR_SAMPLE_ID=MMETSP0891 /ASSEMBLY_ACC=CAM_ASM_000534 /LENGTH=127 /DNA_ID=CAMNT_0042800053 /DNA_START=14 /DNA_END=394 /DNA_ORIENTATION=+